MPSSATALSRYPKVHINSPENAIPHILNLSVENVKGTVFQRELDAEGVCVSVKSACSSDGLPSRAVFAVSRDRRNALSSWRISLSHLTTQEELDGFLRAFDACYTRLTRPQITERTENHETRNGTLPAHRAKHHQKIPQGAVDPLHRSGQALRAHQGRGQDRRLHLGRQGLDADGKAHAGAAAPQRCALRAGLSRDGPRLQRRSTARRSNPTPNCSTSL